MTLNLACGDRVIDGAVNVDFRAGDVTADVAHLPVRDGCADEIVALSILEHFPVDRAPAVLAEWRRVAAPGATLTVEVPDMEALAKAIVDDPQRANRHITNIFGAHRFGPDGAWDTHHWGYTPGSLTEMLAGCGWKPTSVRLGMNMTVEAVAA